MPFLTLISFYYREYQGYRNLNLSMRTMGILVCLGTDFFVEILRGVYTLKRILRKPLTLKPILHNESGNRET